jgi:hypothetical protein
MTLFSFRAFFFPNIPTHSQQQTEHAHQPAMENLVNGGASERVGRTPLSAKTEVLVSPKHSRRVTISSQPRFITLDLLARQANGLDPSLLTTLSLCGRRHSRKIMVGASLMYCYFKSVVDKCVYSALFHPQSFLVVFSLCICASLLCACSRTASSLIAFSTLLCA